MASYTNYRENIGSNDKVIMPHSRYTYQAYSAQMFTLTLTATTGSVAAGNIFGAAAAASTQFGLINPATSNKNLVLTKFFIGVISGTPTGGPVFHGLITTLPTAASAGTIRNNLLGNSTASAAISWVSANGATATGCSAPLTLRMANFSSTNTAAASVSEIFTQETIDGDIIIPPGVMWLPLWSGAGTNLLNAYSVTWYEMGL